MIKVKVAYQSNYNGASVEVDGEYADYKDPKARKVIDAVVDAGSSNCSDEGEFYGDIDDLEEVAKKVVLATYGKVDFEFEEDSIST